MGMTAHLQVAGNLSPTPAMFLIQNQQPLVFCRGPLFFLDVWVDLQVCVWSVRIRCEVWTPFKRRYCSLARESFMTSIKTDMC